MHCVFGVTTANSSPSLGPPRFLLCYFLKVLQFYILFLNLWFILRFFGKLFEAWVEVSIFFFAYRCPVAPVLFVKKPMLLHWIASALGSKIPSPLGLCGYHPGWEEEGHLLTASHKASTSTAGVAMLPLHRGESPDSTTGLLWHHGREDGAGAHPDGLHGGKSRLSSGPLLAGAGLTHSWDYCLNVGCLAKLPLCWATGKDRLFLEVFLSLSLVF